MSVHSLRRLLCLFLTVCLLLLAVSVPAFAAGAFADLEPGSWYDEAVSFVVERGLMKGSSAARFAPNDPLTRAMVITVLYRIDGAPQTAPTDAFSDVPASSWYTDAVSWGTEKKLVEGYPDGTFLPDQAITRGEMVTMLYRYGNYAGKDTSAAAELSAFEDGADTAAWLQGPVSWAVAEGLLNGIRRSGGTVLALGETATRAQFAKLLMQCFPDRDSAPPASGSAMPFPPAPVPPASENESMKPCLLFDVSEIAANSQDLSGNSCSLVDQTHEVYGALLADQGLEDALLCEKQAVVRYYFVTEPQNTSDYSSSGVLYFRLWSKAATTCTVELGSLEATDTQELQWSGVSLQAGWNEIALPLSSAGSPGAAIELSQVLRLRLFDTTLASDTYLIGDVSLYHAQYLPGNTTGSAAQDVAIAADAIRAGLTGAYGGLTVDVRVSASYSPEEIQQKVVSTLQKDIKDYLRDVRNIYNVTVSVTYPGFGNVRILLKMDKEELTIYVTPHFIYYTEQGVQKVSGSYTGSEVITAAVVLGSDSYPVDATGAEDCTDAIQAALDDCSYAGGGVVWLPAGSYRITGTLSIPAYVTLRGDWQDPDTVQSPSDLHYGTILIADMATPAEPLIRLGGSSGVKGMTVYYPEQSLDHVKAYAYAIYNEGQALSAADRGLHTIENITLLNAYQGVGFCDTLYSSDAANSKAEQSYILNVKGTFLHTGLYAFNSSDNGSTVGFTAKADYWADFLQSPACAAISQVLTPAQTSATADEIEAYTKNNAIGLHIGDLEGDFFSAIAIDSCAQGIVVDRGARTSYYGDLFDLRVTNCAAGIQLNYLSGFGVNIACSVFENNGTDLINRSNVAVKLAQVSCRTVEGSAVYTTADDTLTETLDGRQISSYGVTGQNLAVFSQDSRSSLSFSQQLQNELNRVSQAGGGVVYLPAGHYALDSAVTVPANTELRGCAGSAVKPVQGLEGGTVLEVSFGLGSADPAADAAIRLGGQQAGISGLILVLPAQTPNTPATTGYGVYGLDADHAYVANCSVLGFSHGILMERCKDYTVTGVTFTSFINNITARDCSGGHISRCLQNTTPLIRNSYGYSAWAELQSGTSTPAFDFTSEYLDCIILDGSTDQTVLHWYAYRPHDTITLRSGAAVTAFNYGAGGARNMDIGTLITAESGCTALSINSHQKNRATVDAAPGANVRAYNRMTLDGATLVTAEDSYRSTGADSYVLIEPGDSLLSAKAIDGGYDLTAGGVISCTTNFTAYADVYDLSDYTVMAVDMADAAEAVSGILLFLNGEEMCIDIPKRGPQTLYVALRNFGADLSAVSVATFGLEASASSNCTLTSVRLLKELPEGAVLSTESTGSASATTLTTAATATDVATGRNTSVSTVAAAEAPAADGLLSDPLWSISGSHPLAMIHFSAVNISRYQEEGYLHFHLYVPASATDNNYRLELSSSGKADSAELQFEFGPTTSFYPMTLQAGWNDLWFPLSGGAATGRMDFNGVNFIRLYQQSSADSESYTLYLDGFEIVMRDAVDAGVADNAAPAYLWTAADELTPQAASTGVATPVSLEDYGREGIGLMNASTGGGTFQYVRYLIAIKRLADYSGGYLHASVYVPDDASLASLRTFTMELSSNKKPDSREIQWTIPNSHQQFQVGWNELYLPLNKGRMASNDGYTDLNQVNFFRMFFASNTGPAELILADMYATMTVPDDVSAGNLIVLEP